MRLEGKLRLLLELVQGLDCRAVGNSNYGSLVQRIIIGMATSQNVIQFFAGQIKCTLWFFGRF